MPPAQWSVALGPAARSAKPIILIILITRKVNKNISFLKFESDSWPLDFKATK
jgi:hypothetical protein